MAFSRIWRFRPVGGAEREFEAAYGASGDWAELFRTAPGYLGTELRRVDDGSGDFLTIDRWESRDAWEAFRVERADAYDALDRRCASLTAVEELVREFDDEEA